MEPRAPLQRVLRRLLPSSSKPVTEEPAFQDTRRDDPHESLAPRQSAGTHRPGCWAESSVDLELGSDIMEYPDDTAADLMSEYFAKPDARAA